MMNFLDVVIDQQNKFAIGIEETSGRFYLSIPVSNHFVDYEEYYEISEEVFEKYKSDMKEAISFVKKCRERKCDALLMQKPGSNRGVPI